MAADHGDVHGADRNLDDAVPVFCLIEKVPLSCMTNDKTSQATSVRFDWDRQIRATVPEAVFCEGKADEHLDQILNEAKLRSHRLLLTRLSLQQFNHLQENHRIDYCSLSRTAFFGGVQERETTKAKVALVCAGTSDLKVLTEARRTLEFCGIETQTYADIGVAGLWRLLSVADELATYRVIIAAAGMEGALFSVLAGLVPGLVIAVPTSIGYGASASGAAALSSALSSCAPGIVTVNIDNGFGAASAALKILGDDGR